MTTGIPPSDGSSRNLADRDPSPTFGTLELPADLAELAAENARTLWSRFAEPQRPDASREIGFPPVGAERPGRVERVIAQDEHGATDAGDGATDSPTGFRADQNEDGTWNIRGVPVFSVHRRTFADPATGEPISWKFTEKWLQAAIRRNQSPRRPGYRPPLHVQHHGEGEVLDAGTFRLERVEVLDYDGKPTATIYADFLSIPPETFARIDAGRLPYVSVEVLAPTGEPEIDSIALMGHDVPFFRYDNLDIVEKTPATGQLDRTLRLAAQDGTLRLTTDRLEEAGLPALCYRAAGASGPVAISFRFGEEKKMPSPSPIKYGSDVDDARSKMAEAMGGVMSTLAGLQEGLSKLADEMGIGAPAEEKPEDLDAGNDDNAEEVHGADEEVPTEPEDEDEDKPGPAELKASAGIANIALVGGLTTDAAKYEARIAALELTVEGQTKAAVKAKAATDKRDAVTCSLDRLKDYGYGETARDRFETVYAAGGQPALDIMEEGIRRMAPLAPPETWSGDLPTPGGQMPAEVLAYQEHGPEALAAAKRQHLMWSNLPNGFAGQTLESFLSANVKTPQPARR